VPVRHPEVLGLEGWQWVYIFWGLPAVLLGLVVLLWLPDRPHQAKWLVKEEADALENELTEERVQVQGSRRITVFEALQHPKVLLLALAYFLVVTGSYGVQFFMPSILRQWYHLEFNKLTWLLILPPLVAAGGSMLNGWSSDRFRERRLHVVVPIVLGAFALALMPSTQGNLTLTVICFMVAYLGFKSYIPVFWTLPNLLLTQAAAAGSIGLINSIGNLGGFLGPHLLGRLKTASDTFVGGLYCLSVSMFLSAIVVFLLGLGKRR